MSSVPVIGLPADRKLLDPHYFHCVGEKYLMAVVDTLGAIPLIVPALAGRLPLSELVSMLDGLLLTGAHSNIDPVYYGGEAPDPESPADPQRDATNLALIPLALQAGVPVLGICRGLQELNVALGGSLHARVHEVDGYQDHREPDHESLDVQYGPQHDIVLEAGGLLAELVADTGLRVNSLHGQGIDRLADSLVVEARAPDGLIEAVRIRNQGQFALAVQWHPEWQVLDNPFYSAIFARFGEACRARATQRHNNATTSKAL
jgi:putative glutamine amidotransferase